MEEEKMPAYEKGLFYPVKLGEIFNARYQVLGKLGFGANSTVWFCRDLKLHRYVALKIYIRNSTSKREGEILKYLTGFRSSHPGSSKFRKMLDAFETSGPTGEHPCLVHEPLITSLLHLQAIFVGHRLPESALKPLLRELLTALDFLHSEAHVIHTDIQAKNIMIGTTDPMIFDEWDKLEIEDPTPRKAVDNYMVYRSRLFKPKPGWKGWGLPILADFGTARIAEGEQEGLIQPFIYRAPEVVLGMKWNEKVDIWNVGVLIWDLLESRHMFDGDNPEGNQSNAHLLAEMIALLGPPPAGYLKRSKESWRYWDESGTWKDMVIIPKNSLEESEEYLEGENKKLFLRFMRKMLTWAPEERHSARELLLDDWLSR
ncbi:protein kinase domain-containing protein [Arthroderma uncinatum]|uniref:protein kinase domain-containing protein n=1 Tax=Arthroderma uncinatum TaxID=74035 RepID=UPI00144ACBAC|nr:protein kinase domain-containing protein [Arthroderma uncinatum]KAF3492325.1 protein kinase domain-containing protein [Arthroderma uncinatum]